MQRERVVGVEPILHLAGEVVVNGRGVDLAPAQLDGEVDVAAPRRHHPLAVAAGKFALVGDTKVGDTQADRREQLRSRKLLGLHRQYSRQPVAVLGGEAARYQVDTADRLQVHDRERSVKVLEVEGLDQVHAIEAREQLVVRRAPHEKHRGKIVPRQPGQATDRAVKVLAELGQGFQLRVGQRNVRGDAFLGDAELARGHDDLVQLHYLLFRAGSSGLGPAALLLGPRRRVSLEGASGGTEHQSAKKQPGHPKNAGSAMTKADDRGAGLLKGEVHDLGRSTFAGNHRWGSGLWRERTPLWLNTAP